MRIFDFLFELMHASPDGDRSVSEIMPVGFNPVFLCRNGSASPRPTKENQIHHQGLEGHKEVK